MAEETPPDAERPRGRIVRSPVQARQGYRGEKVVVILAVSLALLVTAFIVLYPMYFG